MMELPLLHIAVTLLTVLLAGVIRGYAGFGFSALVVSTLSLIMSPSVAVGLALICEMAASLHLLPYIRSHIQWRMLWALVAGSFVATPLGVWLLATLPAAAVRATIAVIVLLLCSVLLSNRHFENLRKTRFAVMTGCISGAFNGIGALGGMPIVIYCMLASLSANQIRASLAIFFLVTDFYAAGLVAARGLYTDQVLWLVALSMPPLFVGVWLGNRRFSAATEQSYKRFTVGLLVVLSLAGLVRTAYDVLT